MSIILILAAFAFFVRIIYVYVQARKTSAATSKLNREIYSHAYKLGLSFEDLNEFDINESAKKQLREQLLNNKKSSDTKGKTEALQIAEAAAEVTSKNKLKEVYSQANIKQGTDGKSYLEIGSLRAEIRYDNNDLGRILSATYSHVTGTRYKGRYIFIMNGIKKLIEKNQYNKETGRIHKIEYTDGLKFAERYESDDVTDFVEEDVIPIIRTMFGVNELDDFRYRLIMLCVGSSTVLREQMAAKIMTHYVDQDKLDMLLKWLEPFDYMLDYVDNLVEFLEEKSVVVEPTDDPSQGFYIFHEQKV